MQYLSFRVWLISLSITLSRFIRVRSSFHFEAFYLCVGILFLERVPGLSFLGAFVLLPLGPPRPLWSSVQ